MSKLEDIFNRVKIAKAKQALDFSEVDPREAATQIVNEGISPFVRQLDLARQSSINHKALQDTYVQQQIRNSQDDLYKTREDFSSRNHIKNSLDSLKKIEQNRLSRLSALQRQQAIDTDFALQQSRLDLQEEQLNEAAQEAYEKTTAELNRRVLDFNAAEGLVEKGVRDSSDFSNGTYLKQVLTDTLGGAFKSVASTLDLVGTGYAQLGGKIAGIPVTTSAVSPLVKALDTAGQAITNLGQGYFRAESPYTNSDSVVENLKDFNIRDGISSLANQGLRSIVNPENILLTAGNFLAPGYKGALSGIAAVGGLKNNEFATESAKRQGVVPDRDGYIDYGDKKFDTQTTGAAYSYAALTKLELTALVRGIPTGSEAFKKIANVIKSKASKETEGLVKTAFKVAGKGAFKIGSKIATRAALAGAGEYAVEGLQTYLEIIGSDPKLRFGDWNADIREKVEEAALTGAVTGAGIGGASTVLSPIQNYAKSKADGIKEAKQKKSYETILSHEDAQQVTPEQASEIASQVSLFNEISAGRKQYETLNEQEKETYHKGIVNLVSSNNAKEVLRKLEQKSPAHKALVEGILKQVQDFVLSNKDNDDFGIDGLDDVGKATLVGVLNNKDFLNTFLNGETKLNSPDNNTGNDKVDIEVGKTRLNNFEKVIDSAHTAQIISDKDRDLLKKSIELVRAQLADIESQSDKKAKVSNEIYFKGQGKKQGLIPILSNLLSTRNSPEKLEYKEQLDNFLASQKSKLAFYKLLQDISSALANDAASAKGKISTQPFNYVVVYADKDSDTVNYTTFNDKELANEEKNKLDAKNKHTFVIHANQNKDGYEKLKSLQKDIADSIEKEQEIIESILSLVEYQIKEANKVPEKLTVKGTDDTPIIFEVGTKEDAEKFSKEQLDSTDDKTESKDDSTDKDTKSETKQDTEKDTATDTDKEPKEATESKVDNKTTDSTPKDTSTNSKASSSTNDSTDDSTSKQETKQTKKQTKKEKVKKDEQVKEPSNDSTEQVKDDSTQTNGTTEKQDKNTKESITVDSTDSVVTDNTNTSSNTDKSDTSSVPTEINQEDTKKLIQDTLEKLTLSEGETIKFNNQNVSTTKQKDIKSGNFQFKTAVRKRVSEILKVTKNKLSGLYSKVTPEKFKEQYKLTFLDKAIDDTLSAYSTGKIVNLVGSRTTTTSQATGIFTFAEIFNLDDNHPTKQALRKSISVRVYEQLLSIANYSEYLSTKEKLEKLFGPGVTFVKDGDIGAKVRVLNSLPPKVVTPLLGRKVLEDLGLEVETTIATASDKSFLEQEIGHFILDVLQGLNVVEQVSQSTKNLLEGTNNDTIQLVVANPIHRETAQKIIKAALVDNKKAYENLTKIFTEQGLEAETEVRPYLTEKPEKRTKATVKIKGLGKVDIPEKMLDEINTFRETPYTLSNPDEWIKYKQSIQGDEAKIKAAKQLWLDKLGYQHIREAQTTTNQTIYFLGKQQIPASKADSIKGKNNEIVKQVDNLFEYLLGEENLKQNIYFDHTLSRNNRSFYNTNTIDPQSAKQTHRFIFLPNNEKSSIKKSEISTYTDSKKEIEYDNEKLNSFFIAIAQAFGQGVDKQAPEKSIDFGIKAYKHLTNNVKEDVTVESALKDLDDDLKIKIDAKNEIEADILGHYLTARLAIDKIRKSSDDEVQIDLPVEVDASNSGLAIKVYQYALGATSIDTLARTGIDVGNANPKQETAVRYGSQFENEQSSREDLYKTFARKLINTIKLRKSTKDKTKDVKKSPKTAFQLIEKGKRKIFNEEVKDRTIILKDLEKNPKLAKKLYSDVTSWFKRAFEIDKNKQVTKQTRNNVKNGVLVGNYGAAPKSIVRSIFYNIIEDFDQQVLDFINHLETIDGIDEKVTGYDFFNVYADLNGIPDDVQDRRTFALSKVKPALLTNPNGLLLDTFNKFTATPDKKSTKLINLLNAMVLSEFTDDTEQVLESLSPGIQQANRAINTLTNARTELIQALKDEKIQEAKSKGETVTLQKEKDIEKQVLKEIPFVGVDIGDKKVIPIIDTSSTVRYDTVATTIGKRINNLYSVETVYSEAGASANVLNIHGIDGRSILDTLYELAKSDINVTAIHDAILSSFDNLGKISTTFNKAVDSVNKQIKLVPRTFVEGLETLKEYTEYILRVDEKNKQTLPEKQRLQDAYNKGLKFANLLTRTQELYGFAIASAVNRILFDNSQISFNNIQSGLKGSGYIKQDGINETVLRDSLLPASELSGKDFLTVMEKVQSKILTNPNLSESIKQQVLDEVLRLDGEFRELVADDANSFNRALDEHQGVYNAITDAIRDGENDVSDKQYNDHINKLKGTVDEKEKENAIKEAQQAIKEKNIDYKSVFEERLKEFDTDKGSKAVIKSVREELQIKGASLKNTLSYAYDLVGELLSNEQTLKELTQRIEQRDEALDPETSLKVLALFHRHTSLRKTQDYLALRDTLIKNSKKYKKHEVTNTEIDDELKTQTNGINPVTVNEMQSKLSSPENKEEVEDIVDIIAERDINSFSDLDEKLVEVDKNDGRYDQAHHEHLKSIFNSLFELGRDAYQSIRVVIGNLTDSTVHTGSYSLTRELVEIGVSNKLSNNAMSALETYYHEMLHPVIQKGIDLLGHSSREVLTLRQIQQAVVENADYTLFLPDTPSGDTQGDIDRAKKYYEHVSKGDITSLNEFVVMGLTNKKLGEFIKSLPVDTTFKLDEVKGQGLWGTLTALGTKIVRLVTRRLFNKDSLKDDNAYDTLVRLSKQLALANDRGKQAYKQKLVSVGNVIRGFVEKLDEVGSKGIQKALPVIQKYITAESPEEIYALGKIIGDKDKSKFSRLVAGFQLLATTALNKQAREATRNILHDIGVSYEGNFQSLIDDFTESSKASDRIALLIKAANRIDAKRNTLDTAVQEAARRLMQPLDKETREVLGLTILDSDIVNVYNNIGLDDTIEVFGKPSSQLREDIKTKQKELLDLVNKVSKEGKLGKINPTHYYNFISHQMKGLANYMTTHQPQHSAQLLNAENIARLFGTNRQLNSADSEIVKLIDHIVTLQYVDGLSRDIKNKTKEAMIADKEGFKNLFSFINNYHESTEILFKNTPQNKVKGYRADLYDPHVEFRVDNADPETRERLLKEGFEDKGEVFNVTPLPKRIYVSKYKISLPKWNRTAARLTAAAGRGTSIKSTNALDSSISKEQIGKAINGISTARKATIEKLFTTNPNVPVVTKEALLPIYNEFGDIVDYKYTMSKSAKKELLQNDTDLFRALGKMQSNYYDKIATISHNKKIAKEVKTLIDEGKESIPTYLQRKRLVELKGDSPNKEVAELYRLLPYEFKQALQEEFNGEPILVDVKYLHSLFGYRDIDLANAKVVRDNALGIKASSVKIAQALMKRVAQIYKEEVVIKTPAVIAGNIVSNFSQLIMHGVSIKDSTNDMLEGARELHEYRNNVHELLVLEQQRKFNPEKVSEAKAKYLEQRLTNSPVKDFIKAGLFTAIVEDIDPVEYKDDFQAKFEKYFNKLPSALKETFKTVYITKDTAAYPFLFTLVQYSDTIARYALVKQLQRKGVSFDEAIIKAKDAFVDYDLPTSKSIKYANDLGFVLFSKFTTRMQKIVANELFAKKPATSLLYLFGSKLAGIDLADPTEAFVTNKDVSNMFNLDPTNLVSGIASPAALHFVGK